MHVHGSTAYDRRVSVSLSQYGNTTTQTVDDQQDEMSDVQLMADAFADAIVCGMKFRNWVVPVVALMNLEIRDHLDADTGPKMDKQLEEAAKQILGDDAW